MKGSFIWFTHVQVRVPSSYSLRKNSDLRDISISCLVAGNACVTAIRP